MNKNIPAPYSGGPIPFPDTFYVTVDDKDVQEISAGRLMEWTIMMESAVSGFCRLGFSVSSFYDIMARRTTWKFARGEDGAGA